MPQSILVVDDEDTIRDVLCRYLKHEGYDVREAADGHAALDALDESLPDLILLDLMLPGVDGLTITKHVTKRHSIPIIMITARGETTDRILGLDMGADDYIAKPFSPQEVVSRVRAVLRRTKSDSSKQISSPISVVDLTINPATRSVTRDAEILSLTAREFDLLWYLASHPMQVFTRDQLLAHVWGEGFYGDPSTVTVHIRRLREKVESDPSHPSYILTVWGVGYQFRGLA